MDKQTYFKKLFIVYLKSNLSRHHVFYLTALGRGLPKGDAFLCPHGFVKKAWVVCPQSHAK